MTDLANRYGAPSRLRRRTTLSVVLMLALAGLGWLAWAAIYQANPKVRSELVMFDISSEHEAIASFTVVRSDADVRSTCFLRAVAEDHAIVGESNVVVDRGATTQTAETSIRTERLATSVELLGCTAPGQPQRR